MPTYSLKFLFGVVEMNPPNIRLFFASRIVNFPHVQRPVRSPPSTTGAPFDRLLATLGRVVFVVRLGPIGTRSTFRLGTSRRFSRVAGDDLDLDEKHGLDS